MDASIENLADLVQEEVVLTPTNKKIEISSPGTTQNTEKADQRTINNTNLTDKNLILINKCPIPNELHIPISEKLYQRKEKITDEKEHLED